jgi:hypothetical protein
MHDPQMTRPERKPLKLNINEKTTKDLVAIEIDNSLKDFPKYFHSESDNIYDIP